LFVFQSLVALLLASVNDGHLVELQVARAIFGRGEASVAVRWCALKVDEAERPGADQAVLGRNETSTIFLVCPISGLMQATPGVSAPGTVDKNIAAVVEAEIVKPGNGNVGLKITQLGRLTVVNPSAHPA
jgi:hypothetical protein